MKTLVTTHISDNHRDYSFNCGEGNILFHSGDATAIGSEDQIEDLNTFFEKQKKNFDHIVFVPGNHDKLFESNESLARSLINSQNGKVHVLIDQSINLFGLKIYGTPWTLAYKDWAFMKDSNDIGSCWNKIPSDTEILISHSPPYGILDYFPQVCNHLGCSQLMYQIETRLKSLKLHAFGHIHESNGLKEKSGIVFMNSAIMGNDGNDHKPFVLKWDLTKKEIIEIDRVS